MEKVKIVNIKTNISKEIEKQLASDYLGTKEWELAKTAKEEPKVEKFVIPNKKEKEEK